MAVNMNRVIFIKNIKPTYEKRDLQESTDLNRLKELFVSWGFSYVVCTSSSWFIEEDPTHGPIIAWEDDGDITLYLDEPLQYVKFKSKTDDSKICETNVSSKFVLPSMWYIAPNHWAMPIFELGFAIDANACYQENGTPFFTVGAMEYKTEVEDDSTSVVVNETGSLGSQQYSIPAYKINNVNINSWGFPRGVVEYSEWTLDDWVYGFSKKITISSDIKGSKPENFLFSQSPVQMLCNYFNEELCYSDNNGKVQELTNLDIYKSANYSGEFFLGSAWFTLGEGERILLYKRKVYNPYISSSNNTVSVNFTELKDTYNSNNSTHTYSIKANVSGGISLKLSEDTRYKSASAIDIYDITDEMLQLSPGESKRVSQFSGKQVNSAWAKRVLVLRKYSVKDATKGEIDVAQSGSDKQYWYKKDGKVNYNTYTEWKWDITGGITINCDTPTYYAYTIPESLNEWYDNYIYNADHRVNFSINVPYTRPYNTPPQIIMNLNAYYKFAVLGNLFVKKGNIKKPHILWDVIKWASVTEDWSESRRMVEYQLSLNKSILNFYCDTGWESLSAISNVKPYCIIKWKVE